MTRFPFSQFIATLPQFIIENDANWDDVIKYTFNEIGQPSMSEYAIIDKVYDNTIACTINS